MHVEALAAAMTGNSSDALFWQHRTSHCLLLLPLWTHFMHQYYTNLIIDGYFLNFDSTCWISFSYFKGTVNLLCKFLDQLCSIRPHYSYWEPAVISEAVNDIIEKEWYEEPTDLTHHVSLSNSSAWGISVCPFWNKWMNKAWSLMNRKLFK